MISTIHIELFESPMPFSSGPLVTVDPFALLASVEYPPQPTFPTHSSRSTSSSLTPLSIFIHTSDLKLYRTLMALEETPTSQGDAIIHAEFTTQSPHVAIPNPG
jgi:hypothetical protein